MTMVARVGFSAFLGLIALIVSPSMALSDRGDHLWPDPSLGASAAHDREGHDHGHRKQGKDKTKELVSHPFVSRHGASPKCSIRDVNTQDGAGNPVIIRRHLCN